MILLFMKILISWCNEMQKVLLLVVLQSVETYYDNVFCYFAINIDSSSNVFSWYTVQLCISQISTSNFECFWRNFGWIHKNIAKTNNISYHQINYSPNSTNTSISLSTVSLTQPCFSTNKKYCERENRYDWKGFVCDYDDCGKCTIEFTCTSDNRYTWTL